MSGVANLQTLLAQYGIDLDLQLAIFAFTLVFFRIVTMFFFTPFFGGRTIPARVKTGLPIAIAAGIVPFIQTTIPADFILSPSILVLLVLKEAFIGFVLGFTMTVVFWGIQSAGQMVDLQRGVAQAAIFDPSLGAQASLFARFKFQLAIIIFFIVGGHLLFLKALYHTFEVLPIVAIPNIQPGLTPMLELIMQLTGKVFYMTIQLGAPVLIAIFVSDLVLAISSRVAPQINLLFISYTVKMCIGIFMVWICLHMLVPQMKNWFIFILTKVSEVIIMMSHGIAPVGG